MSFYQRVIYIKLKKKHQNVYEKLEFKNPAVFLPKNSQNLLCSQNVLTISTTSFIILSNRHKLATREGKKTKRVPQMLAANKKKLPKTGDRFKHASLKVARILAFLSICNTKECCLNVILVAFWDGT